MHNAAHPGEVLREYLPEAMSVTEAVDRLGCVRYRYDAQREKRYKTVELIVEETDWQPRTAFPVRNADHMVGIRISYGEADLRQKVKQAGAIWRPKQKLWELRYDQARILGLTARIVSR